MSELVSVECANGQKLPYIGFVEVDLELDVSTDVQPLKPLQAMMLVVPTTMYSQKVPVLLGTNTLQPLVESAKEVYGDRYMELTRSSTPLELVFRCLSMRERELSRCEGRFAVVKSVSRSSIVVPRNCSSIIYGKPSKQIPIVQCSAMIVQAEKSHIPQGVEISPLIVNYRPDVAEIPVVVHNHTQQSVLIQPNMILCELQQVEVQDPAVGRCHRLGADHGERSSEQDSFLSQFSLPNLDPEDLQNLQTLLCRYRHIFSEDEFDIGRTSTVSHKIELNEETPIRQ